MANGIFFNNRVTRKPGAYSRIDRSGLESAGLADAGIVVIVGTAEGGAPVTALSGPDELLRARSPAQARALLRSGDLLEAANMAFAPSNDPAISGGAAEVVFVKVNSATQSSASLENGDGPVIDITSRDYGAFTEQIAVSLQPGTTSGFLLEISDGVTTESVDDLGGSALAEISFAPGDDGYTSGVAEVANSGAVELRMVRAIAGTDNDPTSGWAAGDVASVVATAADAGKTITLYGRETTSLDLVKETLTLINGTVQSTTVFDALYGCALSAPAAAAITVEDDVDARFTFAASDQVFGGVVCGPGMIVQNAPVSVAVDSTSTVDVIVYGTNAAGADRADAIALSGTSGQYAAGTTVFAQLEFVSTVLVANANTVSLQATAALSSPSVHSTLDKVRAFINAKGQDVGGDYVGPLWTTLTGSVNTPIAQLDEQITADIVASERGLTAEVYDIINWINVNSQLVSAEESIGSVRTAPNTSSAALYLSGGSEGTAPFSQWQAAFDMLKQARVNTIVPLSGQSAVHAAAAAHCEYMATIGKYECDAIVGLVAVDNDGLPTASPPVAATRSALRSQVLDLNSRHIRAAGQFIDRFNLAGERETFPPYFLAAVLAGMQAGSPVGEPLTNKYASVLGVSQHSSWNPVVDAETMIQQGLCFLERVEGIGFRVVRNITTVLSSDNLSLVEASVNEAVNFAVLSLRSRLEDAVGQRGFAPTLATVKGLALGVLDRLVGEGIIVAHRSLQLELLLDTLNVSVELAPVLPINFVPITVHLVTVPLSA